MERIRKQSPKQIYLRAARRIDNGRNQYACSAIANSFRVYLPDMVVDDEWSTAYNRVFNPFNATDPAGYRWAHTIDQQPEPKELRVFMLCLMAECWRDFR